MTTSFSGLSALPASERMRPFDGSSAQNMRRHKFFGRAIGASRDLFHTTRSLYRREHVSELASTTIEPLAWPKPPASTHSNVSQHDKTVKLARREGRVDMALNIDSVIPEVRPTIGEREEQQHSFHRTRPLSPEGGSRSGSMPGSRSGSQRPINAHVNPLSSHPPSSLKRSKTTFSVPKSVTMYDAPSDARPYTPAGTRAQTPTESRARSPLATMKQAPSETTIQNPLSPRPQLLQSRPDIPPRKDSLPAERRVLADLVDQTVRSGDFRDSRQSVTAYVSAEYSSDLTHVSTLSMTSWLSDPDGPPDDLVSWNQPVTTRRDSVTAITPSRPHIDSLLAAPARPTVGPRSKTQPVYSSVTAPQELPDAQYDRILREKLKHHAGQVKKRLDTSTYYSPTVRQNEIEVHLAFVRAAEEILKQSPIWYGSGSAGGGGPGGGMDEGSRMRYLLQV